MALINPIALAVHVTNSQIQMLQDDGIEIRRDNNDFSPVFACCKTPGEVQRVKQLNDATQLQHIWNDYLFAEQGEPDVYLS